MASFLVHLCLIASGWLLLQPANQVPQLSPVVQVTLSAPHVPKTPAVSSKKVAPPPRPVAPPAEPVQSLPQPPAKQPIDRPVTLPPPPLPKRLIRPVSTTAVKPVNESVGPAQAALESTSLPRQLKPSAAIEQTAPRVATTGMTAAELPESSVAAEPAGSNEDEQAVLRAGYLTQLRQQIERAKKYPLMARKWRQQGVVLVEFELSKRGDLRRVLIRESCGKPLLDRAALQAVEAAAPFPAIPQQLLLVETGFVVPLRFILD